MKKKTRVMVKAKKERKIDKFWSLAIDKDKLINRILNIKGLSYNQKHQFLQEELRLFDISDMDNIKINILRENVNDSELFDKIIQRIEL